MTELDGARRTRVRGLRVAMVAPPGAGKGTQARLLASRTGLPHVVSGELVRAEVGSGSALGRRMKQLSERGELVPDDLVDAVVLPEVRRAVREHEGYWLDGFPRTLGQARLMEALDADAPGPEERIAPTAVVTLEVGRERLVERLLRRSEIEGRPDDAREAIERRIEVYAEQTAPLLAHYRSRGVLVEVDADRVVEDVQADLLERLELVPSRR